MGSGAVGYLISDPPYLSLTWALLFLMSGRSERALLHALAS